MDIFIGRARAGLAVDGEPVLWQELSAAQDACGWVLGELARRKTRRGMRRPRGRVWLSGSLARPFLLRPLVGVKGWEEAIRIAQRLAPEETGLATGSRVWLDGWQPGQSCLAAAADAQVCAELIEGAFGKTITVASVRPWWSVVLNAALQLEGTPSLVAVDDAESVTMLGGAGDSFTVVGSYGPLTGDQSRATLSRALMAHDDLGNFGVWAACSGVHREVHDELAGELSVPLSGVWRRVE